MPDVLAIGKAVVPGGMQVRDVGVLESAFARPRASVVGEDAYPSVFDKAAALLLSLVTNDSLVDGNRRVGVTAAVLFLRKNDLVPVCDEDAAYDVVVSIADGSMREVADVAGVLEGWSQTLPH